MNRIEVLQKKAIRAISNLGFNEHTSPMFKQLTFFKLNYQFDLQMASLLWNLDHDTLPVSHSSYFKKMSQAHPYETRQVTSNKYRVNRVNTLYGKKSFPVAGSNALNKLKETNIYNCSLSKKNFINKLKSSMLEQY